MMKHKLIRHHYTECGLPNVWVQCFQTLDDAGEKVLIIPQIGKLHALIAKEIVMSERRLSGEELRFLRTEIGCTPEVFGKLISRKASTIASWERNERVLDPTVEMFIRVLVASELEMEIDPQEISKNSQSVKRASKRINIPAANEPLTIKDRYKEAA